MLERGVEGFRKFRPTFKELLGPRQLLFRIKSLGVFKRLQVRT